MNQISKKQLERIKERRFINSVFQTGLRARYLGRIARKRMLKGDFSNKPPSKQHKEHKEKIVGYD